MILQKLKLTTLICISNKVWYSVLVLAGCWKHKGTIAASGARCVQEHRDRRCRLQLGEADSGEQLSCVRVPEDIHANEIWENFCVLTFPSIHNVKRLVSKQFLCFSSFRLWHCYFFGFVCKKNKI